VSDLITQAPLLLPRPRPHPVRLSRPSP